MIHIRYICKKRAIKLRKRGEDVRWCGFTPTGKSIYKWFPKIK